MDFGSIGWFQDASNGQRALVVLDPLEELREVALTKATATRRLLDRRRRSGCPLHPNAVDLKVHFEPLDRGHRRPLCPPLLLLFESAAADDVGRAWEVGNSCGWTTREWPFFYLNDRTEVFVLPGMRCAGLPGATGASLRHPTLSMISMKMVGRSPGASGTG